MGVPPVRVSFDWKLEPWKGNVQMDFGVPLGRVFEPELHLFENPERTYGPCLRGVRAPKRTYGPSFKLEIADTTYLLSE